MPTVRLTVRVSGSRTGYSGGSPAVAGRTGSAVSPIAISGPHYKPLLWITAVAAILLFAYLVLVPHGHSGIAQGKEGSNVGVSTRRVSQQSQATRVPTSPPQSTLSPPTPLPNTAASAVLAPGQPWITDGIQVTLSNVTFLPGGGPNACFDFQDLHFDLNIKNMTSSPVIFAIDDSSLSVTSSTGQTFRSCRAGNKQFNLQPDATQSLGTVYAVGNVTAPSVSSITVHFGASRVAATWNIPVPH